MGNGFGDNEFQHSYDNRVCLNNWAFLSLHLGYFQIYCFHENFGSLFIIGTPNIFVVISSIVLSFYDKLCILHVKLKINLDLSSEHQKRHDINNTNSCNETQVQTKFQNGIRSNLQKFTKVIFGIILFTFRTIVDFQVVGIYNKYTSSEVISIIFF